LLLLSVLSVRDLLLLALKDIDRGFEFFAAMILYVLRFTFFFVLIVSALRCKIRRQNQRSNSRCSLQILMIRYYKELPKNSKMLLKLKILNKYILPDDAQMISLTIKNVQNFYF